ncbi:MAG: hypothetical protein PF495_18715 [Spirochaetales bacterium]|nr:hypothetical protein [Spirochaetales bacterium]
MKTIFAWLISLVGWVEVRNPTSPADVNFNLVKLIVNVKDELGHKIDQNNMRMYRLTEAIVCREEHQQLETRLSKLEGEISLIKERIAT